MHEKFNHLFSSSSCLWKTDPSCESIIVMKIEKSRPEMYFTNLLFILIRVFIGINFMHRLLNMEYTSWHGTFNIINPLYCVIFLLLMLSYLMLQNRLLFDPDPVESTIPKMWQWFWYGFAERIFYYCLYLALGCPKHKSCCSLLQNYECLKHLILKCPCFITGWTSLLFRILNEQKSCFALISLFEKKELKWKGHLI